MITGRAQETVTCAVTKMRRKKMVTVKKNTIDRESFEREMDVIKNLVRQGTDPEVIVLAINHAKSRLIEYEEKKDTDPFHIPDWINQDVTVSMNAIDVGDCYGF